MPLAYPQLEDIAALVGSSNGSADPPSNGEAWLGEGRVEVLTDDGVIGHLVRDEDNPWIFVPAQVSR